MSILDRIKNLCSIKGITLTKMEKEIGLSQGASYKWKTSSPSMEVLNKLSNFFNVSIDYLTTGEEKEKPDIPTFAPIQLELIELFSNIKEVQKSAIINLLRSMQP